MHVLVCFISTCGLPLCVQRSVTSSPSLPRLHPAVSLASHTDVAGLAAGVLLGVYRGQAHQLVPTDLSLRAQCQVHGLCVDHLQDDVLGVVEHKTASLFILLAGEETVVGDVERRQPLLTELVTAGAFRCQDQDDVVVGRVHAVEVAKVQVGVGVEECVSTDLKAMAAVWGVLRRFACVEFCVAAEENSLQLAADG